MNHHFTFAIHTNVIIFSQFAQTSNLHHSFQIFTPFSKIISSPLWAIRKRMNKSTLITIWTLFQYQLHRPRYRDKGLSSEVLHLKCVRIFVDCTIWNISSFFAFYRVPVEEDEHFVRLVKSRVSSSCPLQLFRESLPTCNMWKCDASSNEITSNLFTPTMV